MNIKEATDFSEQLKKRGKMIFFQGATLKQIEEFEKEHLLTLPQQLKKWLMFSDGCELFLPAGIQLYGVAHMPLIDVDDNDRPNDNYIVIGTLANGDPILCNKSGCKIFIYNHEADKIESDEIYPDFDSFLNDICGILGIVG